MLWKKYYHCSIIAYYVFIGIYIFKILIFENKSILFQQCETYLSTWVMVIQAIYFLTTSGCYLMMMKWKKQFSIIERCRSLILTSVLFPLTIFCSVTFWILHTWKQQELVHSEKFEAVVPALLNHICHTNVIFLALIECIIQPHEYPSRKVGLGLLYFISILYAVWMHVLYFQTQRWVYPFLDNMNFLPRQLFFIYSAVTAFCAYVLGEKLNRTIHSKSNQIKN